LDVIPKTTECKFLYINNRVEKFCYLPKSFADFAKRGQGANLAPPAQGFHPGGEILREGVPGETFGDIGDQLVFSYWG
jgi:hypothetical protein